VDLKSCPLIDERLVEDSYLLRRSVEPPRLKSPEPVLRGGQAYGTVLRLPDGSWRMYYLRGRTVPAPDGKGMRYEYREALATGRDGLHWETPSLGLIEMDGSRDNNYVMGAHYHDETGMDLTGATGPEGFCVLDAEQQPVPDARSRYTCLYLASPSDRWGGLCLAHSEDGLRWTGYPENPILPGWPDTQAVLFFDRRIGRYVLYTRPTAHAGVEAHANRKMARAESEDLIHWSVPEVVLDTDEGDAPALEAFEEDGRPPRGRKRQFYGLTPFPYGDLYIGLAWVYDVPAGAIWVELVHSPDGVRWQREAARVPYIGDGIPEGLKGRMVVVMAGPPIVVGDELWLYASVTDRKHGAPMTEKSFEDLRIVLLSVPRDRWVSYDAGEHEGELLSRPFRWDGGRLFLNAVIQEGGHITVGFCDEDGYALRELGLDEQVPLTGPADGLMLSVLGGPGPKTALKMPTRGPVRLRIRMRRARLFGWSYETR